MLAKQVADRILQEAPASHIADCASGMEARQVLVDAVVRPDLDVLVVVIAKGGQAPHSAGGGCPAPLTRNLDTETRQVLQAMIGWIESHPDLTSDGLRVVYRETVHDPATSR